MNSYPEPAPRVAWKRTVSRREHVVRWVSTDGWSITADLDGSSSSFRVYSPPHYPQGIHLLYWSLDEAKKARLMPARELFTLQRREILEIAAYSVGTYEPTQVADYLHGQAIHQEREFFHSTSDLGARYAVAQPH